MRDIPQDLTVEDLPQFLKAAGVRMMLELSVSLVLMMVFVIPVIDSGCDSGWCDTGCASGCGGGGYGSDWDVQETVTRKSDFQLPLISSTSKLQNQLLPWEISNMTASGTMLLGSVSKIFRRDSVHGCSLHCHYTQDSWVRL